MGLNFGIIVPNFGIKNNKALINMGSLNGKYERYGAFEAKFLPLGDAAIVVQFGETIGPRTHDRVRQVADYLERHPFAGMIEYVPSFLSVAVYYEPYALLLAHGGHEATSAIKADPGGIAVRLLTEILAKLEDSSETQARIVEIPVCYGGDLGPDLPGVAAHHGLTEQEVIEIHASADYLVYMSGFCARIRISGRIVGTHRHSAQADAATRHPRRHGRHRGRSDGRLSDRHARRLAADREDAGAVVLARRHAADAAESGRYRAVSAD